MLRDVCDIVRSQGRQSFLVFLDVSKAYEICQCMQNLV